MTIRDEFNFFKLIVKVEIIQADTNPERHHGYRHVYRHCRAANSAALTGFFMGIPLPTSLDRLKRI
jgi:hypothetical protein